MQITPQLPTDKNTTPNVETGLFLVDLQTGVLTTTESANGEQVLQKDNEVNISEGDVVTVAEADVVNVPEVTVSSSSSESFPIKENVSCSAHNNC